MQQTFSLSIPGFSFFKFLFVFLALFSSISSFSQTEAEYAHALSFMRDSLLEKSYHHAVSPLWMKNNLGFVYKDKTKKGFVYKTVSFSKMKKEVAFDTDKMTLALHTYFNEDFNAKNLSFGNMQWENSKSFSFVRNKKKFQVDLSTYQITEIEGDNSFSREESVSPDGSKSVFIKNGNLILKEKNSGKETALTTDGNEYLIYGSYYGWDQVMIGENTPPEPNLTIRWSTDGKKILTQLMDARQAEKMYLLDWSVDSLYKPKLLSYYRGSPADTTVITYMPVIIDIASGKVLKTNIKQPHFLGLDLTWNQSGTKVYGLYYHRGYKQLDVIEINAETGQLRTVFTDKSDTNIEYKTQFEYIEEEGIAFITSEKTGWNQLYKIDWKTGKSQALAPGKYVITEIKGVDKKNKTLYFTASGKEETVNPYYEFLYKINFDGSGFQLLTPEPTDHQVRISPDFSYFIDNSSTPNHPTISYVRNTKKGKILLQLEKSDISELTQKGWKLPEIFTTTARDGKTTIYGALWKPTHFDETKKYPIIDYTYTGPHTQVVPYNFSSVIRPYAYADIQALAEMGFIVVQIDGLGSAGRSKEFRDWSYGKLGDNLKDHALAINELGKRYSWIDANQVGIFGHSAGGYDAAHALLTLNDTYKVAVSQAADHDWRMEKAWWPEMYAGWPVGDYYDEQSNITLAPNLKGNLLLIHGGIDENVNPSATFKLAEALIKADKYFDMLIVPSGRHGLPKQYEIYLIKKRFNFFLEHLVKNPD